MSDIFCEPREECNYVVGDGPNKTYIGNAYSNEDSTEGLIVLWRPEEEVPLILTKTEVKYLVSAMIDNMMPKDYCPYWFIKVEPKK